MPPIQRGDLTDPQPFGGRDDGGIHRAEREVTVTRGQLRDAFPVSGEDGLGAQHAGSQIADKPDVRRDTEACRNEVGDLAHDEERDEQRPRMCLEQLEALGVVTVVGVDVRVPRAGIDQDCAAPSSSGSFTVVRLVGCQHPTRLDGCPWGVPGLPSPLVEHIGPTTVTASSGRLVSRSVLRRRRSSSGDVLASPCTLSELTCQLARYCP